MIRPDDDAVRLADAHVDGQVADHLEGRQEPEH